MWELDHKEGWAPKNCCFWTVVLEKPLESPLYSKEIKPVNPKGNQPWICIGKTDAEVEVPIVWPPDVKSWLIRKDLDARRDGRQKEKGMTEDEMVGWHHWPNGHELEQTPGDDEGQEAWGVVVSGDTKSWTWQSEQQQQQSIMRVRAQMPWVILALSQFRHHLFEKAATSTMTLRISKYRPIHNSQWCNLSLWSEFQLPVYLELKLSLWKANRKSQDKWGQLTMISRGLLKIPHSLALSYYWFMPSHVKEGFVLHSD